MAMRNPTGRANYEPNSWGEDGGPRENPEVGFTSFTEPLQGEKQRMRSETFADHYSQARQFYVSQTKVEQAHIVSALTFELSKVERNKIRERMVGHLLNIDDGLAKQVAQGIGLSKMPDKVKPAREPITDLPSSPALSILKNGPDSFAGRKLGIYVAEGGEASIVSALKEAAKAAGAMCAIIAPHVAGAKLSDGSMIEADEKIDGGPSVVFDAVALVMSESAAQMLGKDKPSKDFVNDAFAHAKFIAYSNSAMPLLKGAGVADDIDSGFVELSESADATGFIERCGALRFWDRVSD
jgi:catalase